MSGNRPIIGRMPDAGPDTRTEAAGDTAASRFGAAHRAAVERLLSSYSDIPAGSPVRLAKKTSNLFRVRQRPAGPGLAATREHRRQARA